MTETEWDIRLSQGGDLPFIYTTWMKSYRYDSLIGQSCRNSIFFPFYNKVIDYILLQPDTQVLVACSKEEPEVIFAYMVTQGEILHYVFTKEAFRRQGIAKSLYEAANAPKIYSQKTFQSRPIIEKNEDALTFNPFLLFKHQGDPSWQENQEP